MSLKEIENRDSLPSTVPVSSITALRHRRFFRNGQRRKQLGTVIFKRDDGVEEDEDELEVKAVDPNGNEIPTEIEDNDVSSDGEGSTKDITTTATPQSETSTIPAVAAATTSESPPAEATISTTAVASTSVIFQLNAFDPILMGSSSIATLP
jgi:hypothetical protein